MTEELPKMTIGEMLNLLIETVKSDDSWRKTDYVVDLLRDMLGLSDKKAVVELVQEVYDSTMR